MDIKLDEIKESQAEIKVKIEEMEIKQDDIKESQAQMKVQNEEIERKQDEMKKNDDEIKHIEQIKQLSTSVSDEMKVELNEMKDKITGMERKQDQTKQSVDEMRQQVEKIMTMVHQALPGSNVNNNGPQDSAVSANTQDIVVVGGWYAPGDDKVLNTVEEFGLVEGKSTPLPKMHLGRAASASCVYNGDIIVTGGFNGQVGTDLIEILKMNQHPLHWTTFESKLSVKLSEHHATVYRDKLYITGGMKVKYPNGNESEISDAIYKLTLAPPYTDTDTFLARMPQPRRNHRTEVVNGKLFILGGTTTGKSDDATDKVVVYDFSTNEINPCPSLPKPVFGMSTVTWGNKIIVVGGVGSDDQPLNDVIAYDTQTGQSERLPSLNHKRRGPSAVIMHDVIVVLGGWNKEKEHLNSVERFTMGDDQWKELPGMKEKRSFATAVVKPHN